MLKKLCAMAACVALTPGIYAQQQMELTLERAIEIALSDNPTIKVADLEVERYDYVKQQGKAKLWPEIAATVSYSRSIVQQNMGGLKLGADNTFTGGLTLSLPLLAMGVYKNLQLTDQQALAAVEKARGSKIELTAEVKKAYYNVLLARRAVEVLHASEQNVSETVDNVRRMYDNGLTAEYDLITAEVQLSNLRPSIIQAEQGEQLAGKMLKMYLGIPSEVEVRATGSLDQMKQQAQADPGAASRDLSNNTDMRNLEIQQRIMQKQLELVNSQRLPVLSAFGQAQLIGMDRKPIDFGSSITSSLGAYLAPLYAQHPGLSMPVPPPAAPQKYKYDWQNPISVGVQLSIPIFSGRTLDYQARQTRNAIKQLELNKQYAEQGLNVQLETAIDNMVAAGEKMRSNEKTIAQAEKAYGIASTRYNAGAGTILELNTSELALTQARLNYTQAVFDLLSARAEYDKIIGKEN
ncbi:MAG: TolC family protein [Rikenellaceae bacterium]|nr:TolC family protein [Rikenellaceae bacterium]